MNVMMNNELDVVGLNASENGRCCGMHAVCGQQVVAGMTACFRWVPVVVEGRDEMGIAVHVVKEDGSDGCRIGFLKRHMKVKHAQLEGVTAAVVRVLSTEKNVTPVKEERAFVHHNKGSCKVICTSPWNKIKMEDKKRLADCGVVLSPKKMKNNKPFIDSCKFKDVKN